MDYKFDPNELPPPPRWLLEALSEGRGRTVHKPIRHRALAWGLARRGRRKPPEHHKRIRLATVAGLFGVSFVTLRAWLRQVDRVVARFSQEEGKREELEAWCDLMRVADWDETRRWVFLFRDLELAVSDNPPDWLPLRGDPWAALLQVWNRQPRDERNVRDHILSMARSLALHKPQFTDEAFLWAHHAEEASLFNRPLPGIADCFIPIP